MSFFTGSPSFRRFQVSQVPKHVDSPDFLQSIKPTIFSPLKEAEEVALGWVSVSNLLETKLSYEKIFKDRFLVLGLRMDKRRAPSLIFKAYLDLEEKEFLKVKGSNRLSPEEKKQLKDRVKNRCAKEFPPGSQLYEVVWDFKKKRLYFSGTGNSVCTEMTKLFQATFGFELLPLDPIGLVTLDMEHQKAIKKITPSSFVETSSGIPRSDKDYLGSEFLTWLWYFSDQQGTITLDSTSFHLEMYDNLQLVSQSEEEKVTIHGVTGSAKEASTALKQGKKLSSVQILIQKGEEEWIFTFKGKTFDFKSVKTPPVDDLEETDRFVSRMQYLEEATEMIDKLYQLFLTTRLSNEWEKETLSQIRRWILKS